MHILYLYAEKIISSHVNHDWLNPFYEYNPILYKGLTTIKTCFLQHGVTKDDVSNWLKKFHHNFYLFLTSSDYERNSIINGNYRYSEDVVQALGFPRYDNLKKSDSVKQILFMPTWRKYLKDKGTFKNSKFYEYLDNFFNNKKLLKLLNDYNYKIVFKPHFDLMPFLDILNIPDEITVSIDESYQELFNTSSLLITDYSSVFFDFSYLKKPVIYYRGEDEYHYEQGYFDFETMGFGDIITSEEVLIDKIKEYIENDFEMEDEYKMRVDDFFKFTDQNNSKRVYEWLLNHKG
jgi:CDP-glycerol glycerophosphotransferase (TagB/SpsB family)